MKVSSRSLNIVKKRRRPSASGRLSSRRLFTRAFCSVRGVIVVGYYSTSLTGRGEYGRAVVRVNNTFGIVVGFGSYRPSGGKLDDDGSDIKSDKRSLPNNWLE